MHIRVLPPEAVAAYYGTLSRVSTSAGKYPGENDNENDDVESQASCEVAVKQSPYSSLMGTNMIAKMDLLGMDVEDDDPQVEQDVRSGFQEQQHYQRQQQQIEYHGEGSTEETSSITDEEEDELVASPQPNLVSPAQSSPAGSSATFHVPIPPGIKPKFTERDCMEWGKYYEMLRQMKEKSSTRNPAAPLSVKDRVALGEWMQNQRKQAKLWLENDPDAKMSLERIKLLNNLDFSWEEAPPAKGKKPTPSKMSAAQTKMKMAKFGRKAWEMKYAKLQQFIKENGHCNVPRKCPEYPSLGEWMHIQKTAYRQAVAGRPTNLTAIMKRRLERIGFDQFLLKPKSQDPGVKRTKYI
mmetsp:Transcript_32487/g.54379  ORF Transcript_32487/g.54379 Transcript_32487/m.54379 type:complete len:353 (+) Transcript_32487:120-1178(+)